MLWIDETAVASSILSSDPTSLRPQHSTVDDSFATEVNRKPETFLTLRSIVHSVLPMIALYRGCCVFTCWRDRIWYPKTTWWGAWWRGRVMPTPSLILEAAPLKVVWLRRISTPPGTRCMRYKFCRSALSSDFHSLFLYLTKEFLFSGGFDWSFWSRLVIRGIWPRHGHERWLHGEVKYSTIFFSSVDATWGSWFWLILMLFGF